MKKVIAFDLDGTLAPSKSLMADRMAEALNRLLDHFHVCIISGGKFEQFEKQVLGALNAEPTELERLHIMPTCGTRYYAYSVAKEKWEVIYSEDFTEAEKKEIIAAINKALDDLKYRAEKTWGEIIEDRGSQITLSALGQDIVDQLGEEGLRLKEEWDPTDKKKSELREYIAPLLPNFEVRVGGTTSIDITKPGIDKGYGMRKLTEVLDISKEDIFFIGDKLQEGGNDFPVKLMGIDTLEIKDWLETVLVLEGILGVVN